MMGWRPRQRLVGREGGLGFGDAGGRAVSMIARDS